MKLKWPHRCNGCMAVNKIEVTKPSRMTPTISKYKCSHCESEFTLKVRLAKPTANHDVCLEFRVLNYTASPKLFEMKANEKKSNNPFDKMRS